MPPQSGKLEILVRRNKGRTEHPYYATELAHILKTEIRAADILDLEETDRLFSTYLAQFARVNVEPGFGFKKVWKYNPVFAWSNICHCMQEKLRDQPAILFAGPYEFCGGLKITADRILESIVPLLEFDQDSVRIQSSSSTSGILVDLFDQDSEWFIELAVWGEWSSLAQNCT